MNTKLENRTGYIQPPGFCHHIDEVLAFDGMNEHGEKISYLDEFHQLACFGESFPADETGELSFNVCFVELGEKKNG